MNPRYSLSMGHVFGIRVQLDWSVIIIFMLILVSLGAGVFPAWHPNWSMALTWGVAFGTALVFLASILAHELSHALVAKAYGIPVSSVTLFLFGGIAHLEEEPDSPGVEALMAGVGPAVSIALGVIFLVLAGLFVGPAAMAAESPQLAVQHMSPLATLLAWLGPINILIGVFNLLPGFPLDGGRILRAALWAVTGDLTRATRWAANSGKALGLLLIAVGIAMAFGVWIPVFGTGLVSGLWLVLIGWFLTAAAATTMVQHQARVALSGVPVSRVMRRPLTGVVPASMPALEWLENHVVPTGADVFRVAGAGGRVVGLADASALQRASKATWGSMQVGDFTRALEDMITVAPDEDAYQASRKLSRSDQPALPVVDTAGEVVGFVGPVEFGRWLRVHDAPEGKARRTGARHAT